MACLRAVEHDVLAGEEAHADAGEVEAVEELAKVEVRLHGAAVLRRAPPRVQLLQATGHEGLHLVVLHHELIQFLAELRLQGHGLGDRQAA
jgi:hypothetical protein